MHKKLRQITLIVNDVVQFFDTRWR